MATKLFGATVNRWVNETKARQRAVFRESCQRVVEEMQTPVGAGGNMPIDTGFLRASLQAAINNPPTHRETSNPDGKAFSYEPSQTLLTIAALDIGDTFYATYGANYAPIQESKRGFVRLAAQRWKSIVGSVAREAKQRGTRR